MSGVLVGPRKKMRGASTKTSWQATP